MPTPLTRTFTCVSLAAAMACTSTGAGTLTDQADHSSPASATRQVVPVSAALPADVAGATWTAEKE